MVGSEGWAKSSCSCLASPWLPGFLGPHSGHWQAWADSVLATAGVLQDGTSWAAVQQLVTRGLGPAKRLLSPGHSPATHGHMTAKTRQVSEPVC